MYMYMYEGMCNCIISRPAYLYVTCYGHMIIPWSRPLVKDEDDDSEEELSDCRGVGDGW